jgi:exopolysaccharide biosynthesis polyprenyl glycosylphosphotransferase
MLKQHTTFYRRAIIGLDVSIAGACYFLAYYLLNGVYVHLSSIEAYLWILPLVMILWGTLLQHTGMYDSLRLRRLREVIWCVLRAGLLGLLVFGGTYFIFKTTYVSRILVVVMFLLTTGCLVVEKMILMRIVRYLRQKGYNFRSLLIVGTGPRAQQFIQQVNQHREFGLKIIGLVDDDYAGRPVTIQGNEIIGNIQEIPQIILKHNVDIVVFILPRSLLNRIEEPILFCETVGVTASVAVDLFNLQFTVGKESRLFALPLLTFERTAHKLSKLMIKRSIDLLISSIALVTLLPLLAWIGLVIKLNSKGPVFFKQIRSGLNGRLFTLYKFRTMVEDAEARLEVYRQKNEMEGPVFKMENDPRVTQSGKFLRKFSLDELPQLWNVIRGEMSLVGPRPPLPNEVLQYNHWQRRRLSMRPGITCLWQVNGRNNITDFNKWMNLDLDYIDHWSLWRDLKILLKTIPVVLATRGAK